MENPCLYNLGDASLATINAATAAAVITSAANSSGVTVGYIDGLEGALSAGLEASFTYGSGGTSVKLIVETSGNQGVSWTEVWRAAFATASEENKVNLSALTPVTSPYTPVALSDDTTKDGIIGTWWRARILTVGVYAGNTSLAVRLNAR